MRNWSELPEDLLILIARDVKLMADFIAFHGVCSSWQAASTASEENFDRSWPNLPLLILAENEVNDDRELVSLCTGQIWKSLTLPEAKGRKCMGSRGWLITMDALGEMNLLHPFTRAQIKLPLIMTIEEDSEGDPAYPFVQRAVLSASPSETSDFVLMVAYCFGFELGFWRPGDQSWTRVELPRRARFSDVNYYNGKFYAISFWGDIWVCDVSGPNPTTAALATRLEHSLVAARQPYLVESSGELLVVARDGMCFDHEDSGNETYGVSDFRVIQLDLIKGGGTEIKSLGERAVFVGHSAAFSLDANSFPGVVKPNCIYFTDDSEKAYQFLEKGGGKDMGVYHLENDKIEPFYEGLSFSKISPPFWITPTFASQ